MKEIECEQKKYKDLKLVLFMAVLALVLTGCGRNSGNSVGTSAKDYVYKIEDIFQDDQGIYMLLSDRENIYGMSHQWLDEGHVLLLYQIMEDGTKGESYSIPQGEDSSLSNFCMDEDGDLYCIRNMYYPVEIEEGVWEDLYYLCKLTKEGEELFSVEINHVPEIDTQSTDYFYVSTMLLLNDFIYMELPGIGMAKFDTEGKFISLAKDQPDNPVTGATFIPTEDGKVVAVTYNSTGGMEMAWADLDEGTLSESYQVPGLSWEYSFYPAVGYDVYLVSSYDLYGYNLGDSEKTKLMSFVDSDMSSYGISNVIPQSETEFLASYNDVTTGDTMFARFTKVPPSEVVDKQIITLACTSASWDLRRMVVDFNKHNDTYRISLQDYDSMYSTNDDYTAGINRLNADIASGRIPDIIMLDERMPVESYINKGLFVDLLPFMDEDEEIDRADLAPNIIEAYSVDGKLYRLVPSFRVLTLLAKTSVVGPERGWTIQEVRSLLDSMPENTSFLEDTTRASMLNYCMLMTGDQFVDWEKGQCHFDSQGFMDLLEFINLFPEALEFSDDFGGYYEYGSGTREGRILAMQCTIGDFRNYNYMAKVYFGEAVTMIGFPASDGDGTVIQPALQMAMSARSTVQDGAWEFLRTFLQEEYQNSDNYYGFPVSITSLERLAEEATHRPFYTDENGEIVEYDEMAYFGGTEVVIEPMTQAETEELLKQLFSITQIYSQDQNLLEIVEEEAAPYFSGQKNVESVADVIQRRARLYVSENS